MKKLLMLTVILTASTSFLQSADAQQDPKVAILTPLFKGIFSGNFALFQTSYANANITEEEKTMLKNVANTRLTQATEANASKITFGKPVQTNLQIAGLQQIITFLS